MNFQTGKIAKDAFFLGREDILKEINTYIKLNQSVVLIAPRRYGKSSIINRVINDNSKEFKSISIDLMKIYSKRELAEQIIDKVYSNIGIYGIFQKLKNLSISTISAITNHLTSLKLTMGDIGIETIGTLIKELDEDKLLSYALELPQIIASKLNIKFLFSIDEFGELDKFQSKNELLDKMRSIFQNQEDVVFIFAGSQYALMNKIFTDKNSAFHKFAISIDIPTMKGSDFELLFKKIFLSHEVSISKDFAKEIEEISEGIPYYMVRIAQEVLIRAILKKTMNTQCYSIRVAALKVFKKEQNYFTSELSKFRGKKYDLATLKALANNKNFTQELKELGVSRQNANTVINSLLIVGIVNKSSNAHKISDPFMQRFIKKL